jgi:hypothetical protein
MDFETSKLNAHNSRYDSQKMSDSVDVRFFGLFFALQLFHQRSKVNNMDSREKNPYTATMNYYSSPLSSPRGKASPSIRTGSSLEYQIILNFVKSNLKLFLRLIASDIHNTETSLNSNEFNTLKFFFKIPNESFKNNTQTLSSYAPFFVNFSTTTKINIEIIYEWLINTIYTGAGPGNNNYLSVNTSYSGPDIDDLIQLKNLSKCVTLKENLQNKNVKISQCEDSYIYINSNCNNVKISNCNNCTIVLGSVSRITSIDKCENCNITCATNLIRVSNTIDSTIFSYSISEPILFGDNRALVMAPHNVYYNDLSSQIKLARFPSISPQFINNFCNPFNLNVIDGRKENVNFQIMQPKDFFVNVVPFANDKGDSLPLTPKEYVDFIKEREANQNKIKNLISQADLGEEQEKALHVAIQGYFREWLVNSGNIKNMSEIVKMIDVNVSSSNFY